MGFVTSRLNGRICLSAGMAAINFVCVEQALRSRLLRPDGLHDDYDARIDLLACIWRVRWKRLARCGEDATSKSGHIR